MSWKTCVALVLTLLLVALCLIPSVQKVRETPGWVGSANSLKQIGIALHDYHVVFRKYPPAVVTDKDGKPLYSWRVALLPFVEENALYKQFKLDEPWDSPHNHELLAKMPRIYAPLYGHAGFEKDRTYYQVFVGPSTPFERPGLTLKDISDGPENTLLVVEAKASVLWTKPEDLTYDPKKPLPPLGGLFSKPTYFGRWEVGRTNGFNAFFADGSLRFISDQTEENVLRSLITRNGEEVIDGGQVIVK